MTAAAPTPAPIVLCTLDDLVPGSGVAARIGDQQLALFYLPLETPALYAIGNYDPIGGANVMSRGVVGDIGGELVVASPLYKQHFSLRSGACLEDPAHSVPTYRVELRDDQVLVYL